MDIPQNLSIMSSNLVEGPTVSNFKAIIKKTDFRNSRYVSVNFGQLRTHLTWAAIVITELVWDIHQMNIPGKFWKKNEKNIFHVIARTSFGHTDGRTNWCRQQQYSFRLRAEG